jgi:hypothetical protein
MAEKEGQTRTQLVLKTNHWHTTAVCGNILGAKSPPSTTVELLVPEEATRLDAEHRA